MEIFSIKRIGISRMRAVTGSGSCVFGCDEDYGDEEEDVDDYYGEDEDDDVDDEDDDEENDDVVDDEAQHCSFVFIRR